MQLHILNFQNFQNHLTNTHPGEGIHPPEKRKLADIKLEIMQVLELTDQDVKTAFITILSKVEHGHRETNKKRKFLELKKPNA